MNVNSHIPVNTDFAVVVTGCVFSSSDPIFLNND